MEEAKSNSGQNLGIAALITGIITFVMAVIPCVGMIAIIPGIITIVLAAIGLSQAQRGDSPRGVILAGLIIGIVATLISFSQYFVAGKFARNFKSDNWSERIDEIVNDVQENVVRDLEDASVSIKVEDGDEKVEINVGTNKSDKKKTLEELEEADTTSNVSITITK
jgi:mannose/fructose/N-acetylgalactosamine-specific phosphotransferase system component IID